MSKKMKIQMISTEALRPHPLLGEMGLMSKLIERESLLSKEGKERKKHQEKKETLERALDAMCDDIRENGVITPLLITDEGDGLLIVDGRHRWLCAERAGLSEVPCRMVSQDEANRMISSALKVKPLTKGALAYMHVRIFPQVLESAHGGDRKSKSGTDIDLTQGQLAKTAGVSRPLMNQAIELYRMLHDTGMKWTAETNSRLAGLPMFIEGAREKFEDAIFIPGNGLDRVKSGVLSLADYPLADGEEEVRGKVDYYVRIAQNISGMGRHLGRFADLNETQKGVIREKWSELLESLPPELLQLTLKTPPKSK